MYRLSLSTLLLDLFMVEYFLQENEIKLICLTFSTKMDGLSYSSVILQHLWDILLLIERIRCGD